MQSHCCPVCGTLHDVSEGRAYFAYGRQLSCSPDCEGERRRRSRGGAHRIVPSPLANERKKNHA